MQAWNPIRENSGEDTLKGGEDSQDSGEPAAPAGGESAETRVVEREPETQEQMPAAADISSEQMEKDLIPHMEALEEKAVESVVPRKDAKARAAYKQEFKAHTHACSDVVHANSSTLSLQEHCFEISSDEETGESLQQATDPLFGVDPALAKFLQMAWSLKQLPG